MWAALRLHASRITRALCDFARELIDDAFNGEDPTLAQYDLSVEQFVDIFGPLKPAFIHHPRTLGLHSRRVEDLSCDLTTTYIDVPRLRGVTSHGYLTSGVGYAHHLHRNTWYSAPMAQLNWWLPIFEFESESSMAFHPRYWSEGVPNGSDDFNYYEWNATGRKEAAKQIRSDTPEAAEGRDRTRGRARYASSASRAGSCCSPAPRCTPRSRTLPDGPDSVWTSGPSTPPT